MELITTIKDHMISYNHSIAVAESVTSGHLQGALSQAESATDFFQGGVTTYNLKQKTKLLAIDHDHAEQCNCVSKKVASEMAIGACKLFNSDWAISITGYATEDKNNKCDYLYAIYAIAFQGKVIKTHLIKAKSDKGLDNQLYYTNEILADFAELLATS